MISAMKKNPYAGLMEMAKQTYERDKKSLDFFFDHSDKLITWLIGFGVGGISNSSIEDVLMHITLDFGKTPEQFKTSEQELQLQSLKEYYLALIDHSKKQFYIGATSLAETYELAYKIKKHITMGMLEIAFGLREAKGNTIGFHAKRWSRAFTYFFSASIIFFLICIIIICILFFRY